MHISPHPCAEVSKVWGFCVGHFCLSFDSILIPFFLPQSAYQFLKVGGFHSDGHQSDQIEDLESHPLGQGTVTPAHISAPVLLSCILFVFQQREGCLPSSRGPAGQAWRSGAPAAAPGEACTPGTTLFCSRLKRPEDRLA